MKEKREIWRNKLKQKIDLFTSSKNCGSITNCPAMYVQKHGLLAALSYIVDALILILDRNRLLIYAHQRIADLSPIFLQCAFKNMASCSLIIFSGCFCMNILQKYASDICTSKNCEHITNCPAMYVQNIASISFILFRKCFSINIIQK